MSAHATTAMSHLISGTQMQQSQAQARARIHTPQRLSQESSHEALEQVYSERGYPVQNLMPVAWRAEGFDLPHDAVRYSRDLVLPRRWS
jgi:hypothetical protein